MKLIWKLLKNHISPIQFIGFFIANLIGLTIVLAGLQFNEDIKPLFNQGDSFLKEDYLVISKKVTALKSLAGSSTGFSENEIEDIKKQPFVNTVGLFDAARFRITGGLQMDGTDLYFQTYMFFESVPDKFIDIPLTDWKFNKEEKIIPIIIPRSYLNLYNFGFAESRSMPKLSEGMIKMLKLDINVRGNGQNDNFEGKIVGFSNRLNTILVPSTFITWANSIYGTNDNVKPVRLILEVNNSADIKIDNYLSSKKYETEGDKLNSGKLTHFTKIIINIVLSIGILICLLSFFILILSVYLLIQKNADKLKNLLLIGYSNFQVSIFYKLISIGLNFIAISISLLFITLLRKLYISILKELSPETIFSNINILYLYAFIIFIIISLVDILIINNRISKLRNT